MAQGPEENPTLEGVRLVLLSPLYGGNVGSVCRAMANMGLSDLVIAAPRELDMDEAARMSCSAKPILQSIRYVDSIAEAVADCGVVVGTTARLGLYRQHAQTPRELAPRIVNALDSGKVAIIFGPEDNGLQNEDLECCTDLLRIPTTDSYSSLNISQAVLLCCYELYVCKGAYTHIGEKSEEALGASRKRLFEMWEKMLLDIGFMDEEKSQHMMLGVRRIFSRGSLSEDDVAILMGVARQAIWSAANQPAKQQECQ